MCVCVCVWRDGGFDRFSIKRNATVKLSWWRITYEPLSIKIIPFTPALCEKLIICCLLLCIIMKSWRLAVLIADAPLMSHKVNQVSRLQWWAGWLETYIDTRVIGFLYMEQLITNVWLEVWIWKRWLVIDIRAAVVVVSMIVFLGVDWITPQRHQNTRTALSFDQL